MSGRWRLDFGTVSNIISAEKKVRQLLGVEAYQTFKELKARLTAMTDQQVGELCVALNSLKVNVRVMSMCELDVEPVTPNEESPT